MTDTTEQPASKRYRHVKRGSEYLLLGIGRMQATDWETRDYGEPIDMAEVAIYRSCEDGSLWVRPRDEFEDGRFVMVGDADV